jgi:hypothetical protein
VNEGSTRSIPRRWRWANESDLPIGYFEGLDAERAIAWRAADSFAIRDFLGLVLPEAPPDHSTISRTRRLIDLETHEAVFTWLLQRLADAGLVKGKTVGIDATTLEANAALRSIVRRDSGESYQDFLTTLAQLRPGLARLRLSRSGPFSPGCLITSSPSQSLRWISSSQSSGARHLPDLPHAKSHSPDVPTRERQITNVSV